ncbi:hypothetical protein DERP_010104 [Dermatophagoides pteronyssinus]|uniref:RING-type E3 ubiquitin transferase n=2 Tax=Dermatophagoides pteronyssinus TaxID=6956 RepID=A0ABQ8JEY9_DERPT|nr:hypothetical protein DERP_010104 [Dermatophagoides pteronyssinus]
MDTTRINNPNPSAMMNIFDLSLRLSTSMMTTKQNNNDRKEYVRIRSTSSSSSNEMDSIEQCAICLEDIREKTRLVPCLHQFCQYCLFQWINVKLYCPVCRQKVDKLMFKNANSYDEVLIKSKPTRVNDDFKDFLFQTPTMFKVGLKCLHEYFMNHADLKQVTINNNDDNQKLPIISIEDFRRGLYGSCSNRIIWIFFRNMIYQYNLSPYRDQNQNRIGPNIIRDVSLNFLRERPALVSRIVEFAKFDLENLQKVLNFEIDTVIYNEIQNLLLIYDLSSSEFRFNLRSLIQKYCQKSTDFSYKFYSELNNFARSNRTNAIEYVQNTSYILQQRHKLSAEIITLTESSSSDSDIQILGGGTDSMNKRKRNNDDDQNLILSTPGPSGLKKHKLNYHRNKCQTNSTNNNHHCNNNGNNNVRLYTKKDVHEMRRMIRNAQNSEYFFRKLLLEIKKKFYNLETILNTKHFIHLTEYFKDILLSSKLYRSNKLNNIASKRTLTIDEINQRLKKNSQTTTSSSLSRSPHSSSESDSISDCQLILEQYENANQTQLNNQIIKHALSPSHSITNQLLMMPSINNIQFENHIYSESD